MDKTSKFMIQCSEPLDKFINDYVESGNTLCLCETQDKNSFTLRVYDDETGKGTLLLAHFGQSLRGDLAHTPKTLQKALQRAKEIVFENARKYIAVHCVNSETGEEFVTMSRPGSVDAVFAFGEEGEVAIAVA